MHRRDDGAAVVEFVLVGVLLIALVLGIVQVGVVLHLRNVAVASAAEGARYAANADRDCRDGEQRTRDLLAESMSDRVMSEVQVGCRPDVMDDGSVRLMRVDVTVAVPMVVLPILPLDAVTVRATGRSVEEGQ